MSEHKNKKPGEIKGSEYKKAQKIQIPARWVKQAKLTDKWLKKHHPAWFERKMKFASESIKKQAANVNHRCYGETEAGILEETARKAAEKAAASKWARRHGLEIKEKEEKK